MLTHLFHQKYIFIYHPKMGNSLRVTLLNAKADIKNDTSRKASHSRQIKRVMEKCQNDESFFPNLFAFVSVGQLKAIV